MTDPARMVAWLREAMDAAHADAEEATPSPWHASEHEYDEEFAAQIGSSPEGADIAGHGYEGGGVDTMATARHMVRHDPAAVLRRIAADRKTLDLHTPEWTTVEWPDDQNGKGEAQVCRSCGNKDIDQWRNWKPLVGEAGEFPEGVKPPYIVAPCISLRLFAEGYGWTEETT